MIQSDLVSKRSYFDQWTMDLDGFRWYKSNKQNEVVHHRVMVDRWFKQSGDHREFAIIFRNTMGNLTIDGMIFWSVWECEKNDHFNGDHEFLNKWIKGSRVILFSSPFEARAKAFYQEVWGIDPCWSFMNGYKWYEGWHLRGSSEWPTSTNHMIAGSIRIHPGQ